MSDLITQLARQLDVLGQGNPYVAGLAEALANVLASAGGGGGGITALNVNGAFPIDADYKYYFVNTFSEAATGTLPTTPAVFQTVDVLDITGNASSNPITLEGNGSPVNGQLSYTSDKPFCWIKLIWTGAAWIVQTN